MIIKKYINISYKINYYRLSIQLLYKYFHLSNENSFTKQKMHIIYIVKLINFVT